MLLAFTQFAELAEVPEHWWYDEPDLMKVYNLCNVYSNVTLSNATLDVLMAIRGIVRAGYTKHFVYYSWGFPKYKVLLCGIQGVAEDDKKSDMTFIEMYSGKIISTPEAIQLLTGIITRLSDPDDNSANDGNDNANN